MSHTLPPPPMAPRDIAEYLHVSIAVVYRLIRDGRLAAVRVGGQYRITTAALSKLLEDQIKV
jgi:excisionase family DNA binding protein